MTSLQASSQVRFITRTLFILILCSAFAAAQQMATAVLSGNVTDPQGAAVANAHVTAQNPATTLERTTTTNSVGLFIFNDLTPGTYEVHVEAAGFATAVSTIRVEIGQQTNLKFPLTIAQQKTTVVINDTTSAPLVSTTSSVVDGVVNANQIDNLPLNGRNFLELSLLIPGNTNAPNFDPTKASTVVISSAGQLGRGGNVTIDGMDNNDDVVGGMLVNIPEDGVQEFQIATNRFSAELGRSGSSVVNVVTKSGTNDVHGSASIYERDQVLQAEPATFDPSTAGGETPPFRRQQYAGTIGGPIVKDKAWYFGAFEYRDELGGVLVGTRHPDTSTITNSFATTPATDPIGTARVDWQASPSNLLSFRYSIERQDVTGGASFLSGEPIGSASQRQDSSNDFQTFTTSWTHIISPTLLNRASFSYNNFQNTTDPLTIGPELDFPSIADGASYRVPQATHQQRLQFDDGISWIHGKHNIHFGGQFQRIGTDFNLGVFQQGAVEFIQDFANFDHNDDGVINDEDLLFAVGIRSGKPTTPLILPDVDNNYIAGYIQDDWRVLPTLTLNLGLRYEIDTNVNDVSYYSQLNPILLPFLTGNRHKDGNNWGPRVGFNWATPQGTFNIHGGYGIHYDRVTLEIDSLERGLDGRALPIDVHAGNIATDDEGMPIYIDPETGFFLPGAPTFSDPFIGFVIPGAGGASEGMNVIDNNMQNPMVQQFNLGVQYEFAKNWIMKVDGIHNLGTHFIMGIPVGSVFNPDSGGPESVTSLQSAATTHYDALWVTVDHRLSNHFQFHGAYTYSKSLNFANYEQIPFGYPPVDPTNLLREYGPTPNDQRYRLVLQGVVDLPWGFQLSPLWTYASGVPMDILFIDLNGSKSRVPQFQRNAGGREFRTGAELNAAIAAINAHGGVSGDGTEMLPSVSPDARFNDTFNSFDLRLMKNFHLSDRYSLQLIGEVFNLFNKVNILGVSNSNYSGYFNVLAPNFNNPAYSSKFGTPISTAGGVFGSGGPRAFQLGAKFIF